MRFTAVAMSAVALAALACADSTTPPTTPAAAPFASKLAGASADRSADDAHTLRIYDSCDPATFNAVFNDPTICIKQGHVPFDRFIAELTQTQQAAQWRFGPKNVELNAGENVFALNVGGEVHTFTPVVAYGGSLIPDINALIGAGDAPVECQGLEPDDFVASGTQYRIEAEELANVADANGIAKIQCCIHPWMRAEVHLHGAVN